MFINGKFDILVHKMGDRARRALYVENQAEVVVDIGRDVDVG